MRPFICKMPIRTSRAFTLVEFAVTVLLLGILAVSLWPRAPAREAITTSDYAERLAADIRYAQTLAMTSGQRHCLNFTPASGPPYSGYMLTTASDCTTPVAHPLFGTAQPVALCDGGACINST